MIGIKKATTSIVTIVWGNYENYQNNNCEIKKQMKRGTINDEIDPQSLGTKWLID